MEALVKETLRSLGLSGCYAGWEALVHAIMLVIQDESRLCNVMANVYAVTAAELHLDVCNIERNIRTLIQRAWQVDKERLIAIAGYKLDGPPSAAQFIEIIASYVRNQKS